MKVCILGLWHLGTVISASISSLNIKVLGLDEEEKIIKDLNNFKPQFMSLILQFRQIGKTKYNQRQS